MDEELSMELNLMEVADYKEKLIPEGAYQVVVKKATLGVTSKTQRPIINFQLRIEDTIPAGEDLSGYEEDFEYPIEKVIFGSLMFPVAGDKPRTKNMFSAGLRDWVKNFDVHPTDPNDMKAFANEFVGARGGVRVVYEKVDKDDPDSDNRVIVKKSVPLPA